MPSQPEEREIKFVVADLRALTRCLKGAGFSLKTPRAHEINTLYDLPNQALRKRGELLRLRKYGSQWVLTHKARGKHGRHKVRVEIETTVGDGEKMDAILRALGYKPTFRYEKYRAEWTDGTGHVVVDETPIGNYGEIEGPAKWIDRTARALGVRPEQYITSNYADLFFDWKRRTRNRAKEMTFDAIQK